MEQARENDARASFLCLSSGLCRRARRLPARRAHARRRAWHAGGGWGVGRGRRDERGGGQVSLGETRRSIENRKKQRTIAALPPFCAAPDSRPLPHPSHYRRITSWTRSLRALVQTAASERDVATAIFAEPHDETAFASVAGSAVDRLVATGRAIVTARRTGDKVCGEVGRRSSQTLRRTHSSAAPFAPVSHTCVALISAHRRLPFSTCMTR